MTTRMLACCFAISLLLSIPALAQPNGHLPPGGGGGSVGIQCDDPSPSAPNPNLKICHVYDGQGGLNNQDLIAALDACQPGCNLHFLAGTYDDISIDIPGFVGDVSSAGYRDLSAGLTLYGEGAGATILRSRIYGTLWPYDQMFHFQGWKDHPTGIIIQDMTLDGRKDDQTPPPPGAQVDALLDISNNAIGIFVGPSHPTKLVTDGIIRNVEIKEFLGRGISLASAAGWEIRDNSIHNIGCHVSLCRNGECTGDEDCGPNWDTSLPDVSANHRKTNGFGIMLARSTSNNLVVDNIVTDVTKFGIEVYEHEFKNCDGPQSPTGNQIKNNTVKDSAAGIVINGGCDTLIEGNLADNMHHTGREDKPTIGMGFYCAGGGENSTFRDNVSTNNQSSGYRITCSGGNLTLENNTSSGNCTTVTASTADLEIHPRCSESFQLSGLRIDGHVATTTDDCDAGLRMRRFDDVCITDSTFSGSSDLGALLGDGTRIELRESSLLDFVSTGVFFDEGLDEAYAQQITIPFGQGSAAGFDSSYGGLNDGDSVAFCDLETVPPTPQGCDNILVPPSVPTACDFTAGPATTCTGQPPEDNI